MATFYSDQLTTAPQGNPPGALKTQDLGGRVRVASFSYTTAGTEVAGDVIQLCTLPIGARVLAGYTAFGAVGGTSLYQFGNSTSATAYSGDVNMASAGTSSAIFDTKAHDYLSNASNKASTESAAVTILLTSKAGNSTATGSIQIFGHFLYVID